MRLYLIALLIIGLVSVGYAHDHHDSTAISNQPPADSEQQQQPEATTSKAPVEEAKAPATDTKVLSDIFGDKFINADEKEFSVANLAGKKIGIYFSAHWCPPCRKFTPVLVDFYNKLQKAGKPIEIVFVSEDKDVAAMMSYMKQLKMPWLAVPFGSSKREHLGEKYNVSRVIPSLIIMDDKGNVITSDGRKDITSYGIGAFDRWTVK